MSARPLASVVLLTFNAGKRLHEVLDAVYAQRTDFSFEVVVIDSGSADDTLRILKEYPVRLYQIPNHEFNHGETRNLGARLASGQYVAYITQSATPATDRWLQYLVDAFALDHRVAAVYGRHLPRQECDPITRRDIEEFFKMMGPDDRPTIRYIEDTPEGWLEFQKHDGIWGFYSDANSCLRKSVWEKIPYRPLNYAEDQAFGRDVLRAGYWKVYEPRATVLHSHSYPLWKYFRRQFDEYRGLRESIGYVQPGGMLRVMAGSLKGALNDARYVLAQGYPLHTRAKWVAFASAMNFLRRLAGYLAAREHRLPPALVERLSLEAASRRRAARRSTAPTPPR